MSKEFEAPFGPFRFLIGDPLSVGLCFTEGIVHTCLVQGRVGDKANHAAGRYDFKCPAISVWQTALCCAIENLLRLRLASRL
jgi:hypothetical protein